MSGADLVEETIYPTIVPNLYAKAWGGRAGCDFIENWRGDFVLPAEDTEPASGFIAETADYPESSIDYKVGGYFETAQGWCVFNHSHFTSHLCKMRQGNYKIASTVSL